jgi:Putative prokaryotic signal transducing protein
MAEAGEWEIVKIVGTNEEATVVVGFLQSSGIEAVVESLHASELPTEIGDLANVNIRVPPDRAEEARALLNQREDVATGEEGRMAGEPLPEDEEMIGMPPPPDMDPGPGGPVR